MSKGTLPEQGRYLRELRRLKYKRAKKEERLRRREYFNRKVEIKGSKSRSEKSRSKWRNDPRRDAVIFRYITEKLKYKQPVRVCRDSACTVWLSRKTLADAKRQGVRVIPDLFLPHWDHASPLLKMLGWALASEALGAYPFTLRVSSEVMSQAEASGKSPARYLQDRISRHLRGLKLEVKIEFWFVFEQGEGEEPHLHGAIVVPRGAKKAMASALRAAGGPWEPKCRQVLISERRCPVKWVGYSTKWHLSSAHKMGFDRLLSATQGMKREARSRYQEARSTNRCLYPS